MPVSVSVEWLLAESPRTSGVVPHSSSTHEEFFVPKTVSTAPSAGRRNFTTVNRALSAIGRLRSCVLLRRTPTQTATRHSDSLPVYELESFGLPMTLSATSNGVFTYKVVGSMLPV